MSQPVARVLFVASMLAVVTPALAGIDKVYEKPADQRTWGEQAADLVGAGVYQKSFALVVGISKYSAGYDPLPTERDALRVRDYLLNEAGFDYVHVITDEEVTPRRVSTVMLDELRPRIDKNDRFLFYWSGHGVDVPNAIGGFEGFLPVTDSARDAFGTMVSMADLRRWDDLLRAEQALFLLDTCFSGLAAVSSKAQSRALALEQLAKPSHHIISAGLGEEETIAGSRWGGSLFTYAVLEGLRGAADTQSAYPRDGVVSLNELIAYVKLKVEHEKQRARWSKAITPQMRDLRTNEGEFFFVTNAMRAEQARGRGQQPTGEFAYGEPVVKKGLAARAETPVPASTVSEAQEVLATLGYTPGPTDGVLGIRTRGALRAFQRDKGLEQTGMLDGPTQSALASAWADRTGRSRPAPPTTRASAPSAPQVPKPMVLEPEMVRVPGGTFQMGSPDNEPGRYVEEGPVHTVKVNPFAIGRYEVTFEEYDVFARATGRSLPDDAGWGRGSRPVINVTFEDANAYVRWLSEQLGKPYRLPTEAEWEFAARAGTSTRWSFGDDEGKVEQHAWFGRNSELRTNHVGTRRPNPWELHDVHGNVGEWVEDCWHDSYEGAPSDGSAWLEDDGGDCGRRPVRGGSWGDTPLGVRSAYRLWIATTGWTPYHGFRLAKDL